MFDPFLFLILSHVSEFSLALPHLVMASYKESHLVLLNGGFQIEKESCDFKNSAICLVKRLSNILES